jgi:hypothetical protein
MAGTVDAEAELGIQRVHAAKVKGAVRHFASPASSCANTVQVKWLPWCKLPI